MQSGKNKNGESEYFKRKQTCLKGLTLKMFEHDLKVSEEKESRLLFEIVKKHYKNNPPFGWGSTSQTH